jgi:hypothetical protein
MNALLGKTLIFYLAFLFLLNLAGENLGGIEISETPVKISKQNGKHPRPSGKNKGKIIESDRIKLNAQKQSYCIVYARYSETADDGKKIIDNHCGIGLWEPTICNWSCYDFVKIIINGKNITLENDAEMKTGNGKDGEAFVEFIWNAEEAKATMRFSMKPEDDKLFLTCFIESKTKIDSIQVLLRNYPGFYTKDSLPGKRWAVSSSKNEEDSGGRKKFFDLDPAKDSWVFFGDKVFDVATNEKGKGPSGVMFFPKEITSAKVRLTDHLSNTLSLTYPPDTKEFHLVFWEFPGMKNKDALKYLKEESAKLER